MVNKLSTDLNLQLRELRGISKDIRDENFTEKTTGGHYPIRKGYATPVRRPIGDLLRWMREVEDLLEELVNEAEAHGPP